MSFIEVRLHMRRGIGDKAAISQKIARNLQMQTNSHLCVHVILYLLFPSWFFHLYVR